MITCKKALFKWVALILLGVICFSAACAEDVFAAGSEPAEPGPDLSQAAVSFDQAVLHAAEYVKEKPEIRYFNEVRYSLASGSTGPVWSIVILDHAQEACTVLVNAVTGEIEQFSVQENES